MEESSPLLREKVNGSTPWLWLTAMTISWGAFLFGYDSAVLNGPTSKGHIGGINGDLTDDGHPLNDLQISVAQAAAIAGAGIGAFAVGPPSDRFGRRLVLLANNLFFILGTLLSALASHYWMLILGRVIVGFGIGIASVLVPQLLGEISPSDVRGALGVCNQLGVTVGLLLTNVVFYVLSEVEGGWRLTVGFVLYSSLLCYMITSIKY